MKIKTNIRNMINESSIIEYEKFFRELFCSCVVNSLLCVIHFNLS